MEAAYVIFGILLAISLVGSAMGKLSGNEKVVSMITGLGVSASSLPLLAGIEIVAALGLLVGLVFRPVGAAAGLIAIVYFAVAVAAHLRRGDREFTPALVLGSISLVVTVLAALTIN